METKKYTDSLIESGVDKITKLLDDLNKKIEKISNYHVATNCRWNNKNIRTLSVTDLIQIYKEVVLEELSWKITKEELNLVHDTKVNGFSINDWKGDLKHLIESKSLNAQKDVLLNKKNSLTELYSDEKKTLSSIEALLAGI